MIYIDLNGEKVELKVYPKIGYNVTHSLWNPIVLSFYKDLRAYDVELLSALNAIQLKSPQINVSINYNGITFENGRLVKLNILNATVI